MPEQPATLYCAFHPGRETLLRCNQCDKPICYQCAVRTPVGYRCKACISGQQAVFYNGRSFDWVIAGLISLVLGGIAGALAYFVLGMLGWYSYLIAILAGPFVGGLVAEAVRRATGRRRSKGLKLLAAGGFVVGALLSGMLFFASLVLVAGDSASLTDILRALVRLDVLLLTGLAASTIYARLL